jgi:1-acyl-sn-glycerol-3-phosphate acyltransferase
MEVIFLTLYRFFNSRRSLFFAFVLLVVLTGLYFASKMHLEEDISKSMPGKNDQIALVINHSRLTNKLIIPVFLRDTSSEPDPDKLIAFADRLTDSLRSVNFSSFLATSAFSVSDTTVEEMMALFYENIPLFLTEEDYAKIDSLLLPENMDRSLQKNINTLTSPTGFALKKYILQDPLGIGGLALSKLKQFQIEEGYDILNGYIFTRDRKTLLIITDPANPPSETLKNGAFFKKLDKLLTELSTGENSRIKAEYYGASAVAVGNAEQIKADITLTVSVSIIIILLFVGWFFRKVSIPFISFLPAVFGGIGALALIFLLKGSMSTIALGIGSVLLGIIVDYALYFYSIYKTKDSIEAVISDLSISIIMCSVTSAIAFFSLLFVKSEVLRDLGLFAGLSILGSALFSLIILPHLVKLKKQGDKESVNPVLRISSYSFESNRILILVILIISVIFYFSRKAGFETDMYSINYLSPKMKTAEKDLSNINDLSLKSVYVVSTGKNLDQALTANAGAKIKLDSLKAANIVSKFSNAGSILISDSIQRKRIERWKNYWTYQRRLDIENQLAKTGAKYGFNQEAFLPFHRFISSDFEPLGIDRFSPVRSLFLNDMITEMPGLTMVISIVKMKDANRHQVYADFSGLKNTIVIDRQEITSSFVGHVRKDFDLLVKLCLIFVTLALILSFGRIETGFIAAVPMFLSWLWTLGFMGIFDIKFNIINIIVSTFVFGLGVDYSILMMRGLLLEYRYGRREMTSYRTSIFLSGFTTIVGVGVLILARHPSLHSIALISVVGLLSVILISYSLEPLLFKYLIMKKKARRVLPVTFLDILTTILVFSIFAGGSLVLNLVLLIVIILPVSTAKKKYFMHKAMAFCCRLPVYAMVHIRKTIINNSGEDFSRPALIISNHQSHIDLLLLLMLNPRIIVITTKWVWNNPIYALVIRYLEFYPTLDGYEEITGKLKASVEQGYSVLVFPEGSRSADMNINRFHKGAFVMAHNLGLDILPVFIHGAGDCMTKGENHLRGGSVTVKIYPRITPGNPLYGKDYQEQSKNMLSFYRQEWKRIREELETPAYFSKKLIRNYIYKGPLLEWYTRIKLRLENNYSVYDKYIPRNATIVDLGCGYGYLAYLLSFISHDRKILGIDYDVEKIELADHCISKNDRVTFMAADASSCEFEKSDVFILNDMLHYLPENKQDELIRRCISALNAGGMMMIRDADKDLEKRHLGTRYTEFFSTHSGFNKAKDNRLFFFSGNKIREIARENGLQLEVVDSTKLTSNILYVLRKQN